MKKFFLPLIAMTVALTASAQLKISILGDSYSTFEGMIPKGYDCWYFHDTKGNDVKSADQTWWHLMADANGLEIDKLDSWSGSTVSYSGYRGEDYKDRSFNTRVERLGNPEVIFIFGGTNDDWAKSPIGEYKYSSWTEKDMYSYRPAFAKLLDSLKKRYPNALIINICNSELGRGVTESMAEICKHYGVDNVRLQNIDKQRSHPSQSGMKQIASQVWKASAPLIYNHLKASSKN